MKLSLEDQLQIFHVDFLMQDGEDRELSIDDINGVEKTFSTDVMTFRSLNEIKKTLLRFPHTIQEHFADSNMINTP